MLDNCSKYPPLDEMTDISLLHGAKTAGFLLFDEDLALGEGVKIAIGMATSLLSKWYRTDRLSMFPASSSLFQYLKENKGKYDGFHIGLCFYTAAGNSVFTVHTPHQSPLCSTVIILVFITVQLSQSQGA